MNDRSELLWRIIEAGHSIEDRLDASLAANGLSMPKFQALRHLVSAGEPLALGQLAERIACVKSNVTQLVDRLENEGLVRRIPDPNDRRSILAMVTAEGLVRFQAGSQALLDAQAEILAVIPPSIDGIIDSLVADLRAGATG